MVTLAERLGFERDDRVAVVHVDDSGMCHASNEGGFECLENGPATCGSIMVPCPWFGEAAERARANPDLDLGVHLTLNAEWAQYRWGRWRGVIACRRCSTPTGCCRARCSRSCSTRNRTKSRSSCERRSIARSRPAWTSRTSIRTWAR